MLSRNFGMRLFSGIVLGSLFLSLRNLSAQQVPQTEAPSSQQQTVGGSGVPAPTPSPAMATATPASTAPSVPAPTTDGTDSNTIRPATATKTHENGQQENSKPVRSSRILGIIPNYRTVEEQSLERVPLTAGQKYKTAAQDSFDPSAFLVAGVFAGTSMAQAQYKEFGVGAEGFGKYYAAAFADQAIGNFFTEAILPSALHQDPQYYTKGRGGFWKRTGYALEREVVTFGDNGHNQFNTSEIVGNAIAAGISNAYYPAQERSVSNTMQKWGQQIGTDAIFNVMKEFWPDVRNKVFGK